MNDGCFFPDPYEDVGYLIWRVFKYWHRGKLKLLDEFGLTSSQLELLGAIYHMSIRQIDATQIILSQETDIDPMTTSTIIRNLEKKGLVSRRESKADTRARIVEVTKKGAELFDKAHAKLTVEKERVFKNIDTTGLKEHLKLLIVEMDKLNKANNN